MQIYAKRSEIYAKRSEIYAKTAKLVQPWVKKVVKSKVVAKK